MEQKPQFRYYYGNEAEQFSFFKIPKLLITHEFFRGLSNDAKILYGLLLDRMSLSRKNKWFDEENRAYIVCSIEEISELLNCSRNKAIKSLQELDTEKGIGLIEKRRLGQGNNTIMYVKNFLVSQEMISQQSNADTVSEVQNVNFQKSKIRTSKSPKNKLQEVQILDTNNTYNNHTEKSNQDSNRILSGKEDRSDGGYDAEAELKAYQSVIRENIDYDSLMVSHPNEKETIEGIYQLILETVLTSSENILIASSWYPASLVKSKFMKLTYSHVEYVLDRLRSNTTKVRNIKKYILASLFNAPNTIDSYYRAEVNHDFPQYAAAK
jgi:hypothetical protein